MTIIEQLMVDANFKHSRNVSSISKIIALAYGYNKKEAGEIEQAALFHDIGKTAIPPAILNKQGPLTPEEFTAVKNHTEAGHARLMEAVGLLMVAAAVAKEHHERLDGSGYLRMPGSDMNPYARLISIADVFDALLSRRAYKPSWGVTETIQYLNDHTDHFDNEIVRCLISELDSVLLVYKNRMV